MENELKLDVKSTYQRFVSMKAIGRHAKGKRKQEKLSMKAVAELAGCSHVSVANLEKGEGRLNMETAWRILDVLGLVEKDEPKRPTRFAGGGKATPV